MKRDILEKLVEWSKKPTRKPLVLSGARQVGKTWALKEFGRVAYKNTAYFNFDANPELSLVFEPDFNVERIVLALSAFAGFDIVPNETLIILDEIQLCPRALTSLKYWCENAPGYHIAAAGSLIGLSMNEGTGYPVGKTESFTLFPMSFGEFLAALGEDRLVDLLEDAAMMKMFAAKLTESLRYYFYVGGMPAAVATFVETKSLRSVREIQENILTDYERDFSRHAPKNMQPKIRALWRSLPVQLDRTDRRFVAAQVDGKLRARDLHDAFEWLEGSGLAYRVWNVTKPAIPLSAYRNHLFKLFSVDVGLLAAQSGLSAKVLIGGDKAFTEFKGALCEQFVQQELRTINRSVPYYWTTANSQCEIDVLYEIDGSVVPIEVKAETNLKAKSLKSYLERFHPELAIRTSLADFKVVVRTADVPLYGLTAFVKRESGRDHGGREMGFVV